MQAHLRIMRTTLDIEDGVLAAVKELARRQQRTPGEVLSALARQALTGASAGASPSGAAVREPQAFYGFESFESGGKLVSNEHIDELRDREGV
jgi:hypothetical protein